MFSLPNMTMNKMTDNNPLLAMMQFPFGKSDETVKNATDAWMKAMSPDQGAANPMSAAIATSTLGLSMYTQMMGTMFGAMTEAMGTVQTPAPAARKTEAPVAEVKTAPVPIVEKTIADAPVEKAVAPIAAPSVKSSETVKVSFAKPTAIARPQMPDDLKVISGIGPKLEQVLNNLGVWTYAQIANWKAEEIAWVDDFLQFNGRIERDEWLSQAATLVK